MGPEQGISRILFPFSGLPKTGQRSFICG